MVISRVWLQESHNVMKFIVIITVESCVDETCKQDLAAEESCLKKLKRHT